jgi:hypothetical protein
MMGVKTYYLPRMRESSVYMNLVAVSLLVFNRRLQDATGDRYGSCLRQERQEVK